jgi:hypothetical protein
MSERGNNRPEAEIIPPDAPDPGHWSDRTSGGRERTRVWAWSNDQRYRGLRYGRTGPLGFIAIFAALAALGALGFFVFLGALAMSVPLVVAVVVFGIIGSILRRL